MKTDFLMFCCSLQVGTRPSISRAMLTSAAGNQNYGKLPVAALRWPGALMERVQLHPGVTCAFVPAALQSRAGRDAINPTRLRVEPILS